MKSNIISVTDDIITLNSVLDEVEKVAAYNNLSNKQLIQLRLISEEAVGVVKGILGFVECNFFIESKDNSYKICITSDVAIDEITKDRFIEISSNKTNEAYKGFTGFIRQAADTYMNNPAAGTYDCTMPSYMQMMEPTTTYDCFFTLSAYKTQLMEDAPMWDELEKSILANVADDIAIAARNNSLKMVILKNFK